MGSGALRRFGCNRALVLAAVGALAASGLGMVPATAASGSSASSTREISSSGTTTLAAGDQGGAAIQDPEISAGPADAGGSATSTPSVPSLSPDRSQTAGNSGEGLGAGDTKKDRSNAQQLLSFDGLNHFAQRTANGGNQFSIEPPDQGLCAGNGFVLETVNDVMAVYDGAGNKLKGPVDLNTFYKYPAAIDRSTGARGPEVTDPSCYYDVTTQRWFHVALTIEVFSNNLFNNGRFQGPNHLDIAVSQTADPTGAWTRYQVPVQDDGTQGTPNHHCSTGPYAAHFLSTNPFACLGDYPHIGADANGFYITTNEYSFFGPEFKAAQVYAFSKQALAAGSSNIKVTQIDTTNMVGGSQGGFTVWPSEVPNGQFDAARDGTEYFMSSNAADEVNPLLNRMSTDLVVWALTNTQSLNSSHPDVSLVNTVVSVGLYAAPPHSNQKVGSTPLRDCINDTTVPVGSKFGCWRLLFGAEPGHHEVESVIDSNDTRMQQVTFADGMLFGALDTALKVNGKTQAGIEWFATRPHLTSEGVHAQVVNQGYVGAGDTNLTYPALAVNENGAGAIAFTLLGTNDYPSAAYAPFDVKSGVGSIHIAAAGLGPDDGFTSYVAEVGSPPRTRWGDYGAAVVDGSKLWIASEYIGQTCTLEQWVATGGTCGGKRTSLANWDTRITELAIGGE